MRNQLSFSVFTLGIIALVSFLFLSSCRDKYEDCTEEDYLNCNTIRPATANADVRVTLNAQNPTVLVRLYKGDFEKGQLVRERHYTRRNNREILNTEENYSITAMYFQDNDTVLVVDGGRIGIISYRMCEDRCYEARELTFDLRLP